MTNATRLDNITKVTHRHMGIFRLDTSKWHIVRVVFVLAGTLVLTSVGLTLVTGTVWWLALAGLVGVMQLIFAFTGYCPAAIVLDKIGIAR